MVDFCVNVHGLKSLWRLEVSTYPLTCFNMNISLSKVHCELKLVTVHFWQNGYRIESATKGFNFFEGVLSGFLLVKGQIA